jgi:hypothetical protein
MDTAPPEPTPSRGRRFRARRADGRRARRALGQEPSWRDSRRTRWLLASTGVVLLVVSIIMMAYGA